MPPSAAGSGYTHTHTQHTHSRDSRINQQNLDPGTESCSQKSPIPKYKTNKRKHIFFSAWQYTVQEKQTGGKVTMDGTSTSVSYSLLTPSLRPSVRPSLPPSLPLSLSVSLSLSLPSMGLDRAGSALALRTRRSKERSAATPRRPTRRDTVKKDIAPQNIAFIQHVYYYTLFQYTKFNKLYKYTYTHILYYFVRADATSRVIPHVH